MLEAEDLLHLALQELDTDTRVAADLGAGTGFYSQKLLEKGFTIDAYEIDSERLTQLNRLAKNHSGAGELNVINESIVKLNPVKNRYSLILLSNVMQFLSPKGVKQVADWIYQALRSNGFVLIRTFTPEDETFKECQEDINFEQIGKHAFSNSEGFWQVFTKDTLTKLFNDFEIIHLEKGTVTDDHPPFGDHEHSSIHMILRK